MDVLSRRLTDYIIINLCFEVSMSLAHGSGCHSKSNYFAGFLLNHSKSIYDLFSTCLGEAGWS